MVEPRAGKDAAVDDERPIRSSSSGGLSPTLGARLHRAGQRLAGAHQTTYGWEPAVRPVLARMSRWQDVNRDRFARTELDRASAAEQPRPRLTRRPGPEADDPGRPMPADVRSWLREVAGPGAERVRVHADGEADALARRHAADAVTWGEDTYVRSGRFSVEDPAGRGLLAHEAAHVAAAHVAAGAGAGAPRAAQRDAPPSAPSRPDPSGRPPEPAAPAAAPSVRVRDREHAHAEEANAQALERAVRTGEPRSGVASPPAGADALAGAGRWFRPGGDAAGFRDPHAPAAPPAPTPLAGPAAAGAAAGAPAPSRAPVGRDQPEPTPTLDLAALRRDLVGDLMRQLRTEFERGG